MNKTKIEWADSTWNPVTGCYHGCEYCYARKIAERFGGYSGNENPPETRLTRSTENFETLHEVYSMQARREKNGKFSPAIYPYGFEPTFHKYRLDEPEQWTKPRNIFVCSMADLFGDWVPDSWIEEVFAACEKAPQHRYLFLTKNPQRYMTLARAGKLPRNDNMWYGTTATNNEDAHRFNYLPAGCNVFVSIEPLHEDIAAKNNVMFRQVDWIIIGAETGNSKGKIIPNSEWVMNIVWETNAHNTPVFMKDSLISIVGEKNMFRELPWESQETRKANIGNVRINP